MTRSGPSPRRDRGAARAVPGGRPSRDVRRRVYSQNFLRNERVARRFLDLVDVDPALLCLEIGAGDGALTRPLSGLCDRLVAYEIDRAHAAKLTALVADRPGTEVVVADFTGVDPPAEPFQAVGNVPFSITSAIVDWCLAAPTLTSATLITQLEYARKRTGDFGRWSQVTVLSWPEYAWRLLGTIRREDFRPVPRVDAGVLRLTRRDRPLGPRSSSAAYRRMVEIGFQGVGGSLFASLSRAYPRDLVANAFQRTGVAQDTIVAFVHPDAWWELFTLIDRGRRPTAPPPRSRRPR